MLRRACGRSWTLLLRRSLNRDARSPGYGTLRTEQKSWDCGRSAPAGHTWESQGRELITGLLASVIAPAKLTYRPDRPVVINLDAMPEQALIGFASPPLGFYFAPRWVAEFVRIVQEVGSVEVNERDEPEISELVGLSILKVETGALDLRG